MAVAGDKGGKKRSFLSDAVDNGRAGAHTFTGCTWCDGASCRTDENDCTRVPVTGTVDGSDIPWSFRSVRPSALPA